MIYESEGRALSGARAAAESCVRSFGRALAIVLAFAIAAMVSQAQDKLPPPPVPVDTTPLIELLTEGEKASLARIKGSAKELVEEYVHVAEAHLNSAITLAKSDNAHGAVNELNIYNKAMAEAGKVAFAAKSDRRKISKKLEQILYKQIKTLESIERMFPTERQPYAELALKNAKQLRVQALNEAFAGGDILKDPDEAKPKNESPGKDGSSNNPPLLQPLSLRAPRERLGQELFPYKFQPRYITTSRVAYQIPGDYLTEEEDNHVREAQEPDKRVKVFMKIADRRIAAIAGNVVVDPADKKAAKKIEEEIREWGALPKLSRTELLRHYARAVEESMIKLEDAYERNPKSSALPKALATLREATDKHLESLRALSSQVKGESEEAALREAIGQAETANKGARDGLKQS